MIQYLDKTNPEAAKAARQRYGCEQFDAVIHFDDSRAVEPLERTSQWQAGEFPETYPSAV